MSASSFRLPRLKVAVQFLLALALLLGSVAWQPAAVQAAPQRETARIYLHAWITGSRLNIDAEGLPGKQYYIVRVRSFNNSDWVRLGRVKSTRQGDIVQSLKLPKYLYRFDRLHVCLKSVSSGRTYCTLAHRY